MSLMFPKHPKKKKRLKHRKSILHVKNGTCYLCMSLDGDYNRGKITEEHHIFGGPNRKHSEAAGLKVHLCVEHHRTGPKAVHRNQEINDLLHIKGQQAFERDHTRKEFMGMIGKNYL